MAVAELAVDACCLLNLLATAREVEIVEALDVVLVTTPQAHAEVLYLAGPDDEEGEPTRIPAETTRLVQAGRLLVPPLAPSAIGTFVLAAERLRDADASVVALAVSRGCPLASDDGRVRNTVGALFGDVDLQGTLGLVRRAARRLSWDEVTLRSVAASMRLRGNFLPPRRDPDRDWYASLLR